LANLHSELNGKGISLEVVHIHVEIEPEDKKGKAVAALSTHPQKDELQPFLTLDPEHAEKVQVTLLFFNL
jgi:hypothetical protein